VFFLGGCLSVCLPVLLSTAELSSCFHRILEIIITLTKANKTAMSHLYKLGAFEILLWKLLASDIVDGDKSRITKFLSQTHLLQSITPATDDRSGQSEHRTSGCDSSLYPYLPEGVILNLISEVGTLPLPTVLNLFLKSFLGCFCSSVDVLPPHLQ
jgi:hypothetical protein